MVSGRIVDLAVYEAQPHVFYAASSTGGLYKTTNNGTTWQRVLTVDANTGVVDVAMDPSEPNIMYAASYQRRRTPFGFNGGGPGSALWKSTDGGDNWRKLTRGLPDGDHGRIGIAIFRGDPRTVYVSVEQGLRYTASTNYEEPQAGLYRSDDRGESFTQQSTWNPRPMYASQVIVDPVDPCRIYRMNFFSGSTDCGKTSKSITQSLHGDDRFMWINPANPLHMIKADDGGIGISHDRAATWHFIADLPVSQWYRVSFDMRKPYNIYGGLQDNGSWGGPSATYRAEGITTRLARYCARNPVALERLTYDRTVKSVTYRSDKSEGPTAGTETVDPLEFLARVLVHIPDKGHVTTRYYGWYANRPRGRRRQAEPATATAPPVIVPAPRLAPTEASRRWAALLQQIFEVDPLACPACHGTMRIVACITQASVIDRILTHLTHLRTSTAASGAARSPPSTRRPSGPGATRRATAAHRTP